MPDVWVEGRCVWVEGRCVSCSAIRVFEAGGVPAVRPSPARPPCSACEQWLDRHLARLVTEDGAG